MSTTRARRSSPPRSPVGCRRGPGLDVCTGGELALALHAGFDPSRIALHGNNKSVAELTAALDAGVGRIVVDSFDEIDRLAHRRARSAATRPRVLVRTTVGVEAHTHEFIATAHEDQKFGFSLAGGAAKEAARRMLDSDVARAGRSAFPYRLADLRHRGLRGVGASGRRVAARDSRRATASSCPSSTSAAASASPTSRPTTRRKSLT